MEFREFLKTEDIDKGINVSADTEEVLKKILGDKEGGVHRALMTALDGDEKLVSDVINKVGMEIVGFLPQFLGKNAR